MNKLPVIYLTIDDNEEAGVDSIALVDEPAIERNWMAFSKQPKAYTFEITNEEKRVISGPLMIADLGSDDSSSLKLMLSVRSWNSLSIF